MLKDKLGRLAVVLLFLTTGHALAQCFTQTGDWEADKRNWLACQSPQILVNKQPQDTIMNGVLWPTLVQVQAFLASYHGAAIPCGLAQAPLCITGGSERFSPSGKPLHDTNGLRRHGSEE